MKKYYRPDIDGLRAFAVIPVIFFHLGILGFSGGFVGVDIFFVISGYLISSIIIRELKENRFSFIQFWERRVRRIFPVLFFILLTTTIAGYFITIFPPDFVDYGQSLATQSLFLINIFFMRTNDYFAAPTETIPLLHTWSLAVEEQFYIIFPLLLFLLYRYARQYLKLTLITFGLLSFIYSVYLVNIAPNVHFSLPFVPHIWGGASNSAAGFYFPLARAWELIVGALISLFAWQINHRRLAEVISFAGMTAIVATIYFVTEHNSFPGAIALIPVLGAGAIIIANTKHNTFTAQILSHPALVGTGLISYSLYLWHWPLIVFTQQYINGELLPHHINLILIGTFLLSLLSYYLIETPFRKKTIFKERWKIFTFFIVGTFALVATGFYITKQNGLPERAPIAARAVAVAATDTNPREYECFRNNYRQILGEVPPCLLGNQSSEITPSFVVWGDSHANAAMPAFDTAAKEQNKQGVFFAVGGCPPLIVDSSLNKDPQCNTHNQKALSYITEHKVDTVFIVASWRNNYPHTDNDGEHSTLEALTTTLDLIPNSTKIILMQRVPQQTEFDVRKLFYTALETETLPTIAISLIVHNEKTRVARRALQVVAKERDNVELIDPNEIFCTNTECLLTNNEAIIYTDRNHINTTGALLLTPLIKPYLK